MTNDQHAAEAATLEALHTGDYAALPDLEYTPITDPLPAVVSAAEVARLREENAALRSDIADLCGLLRLEN